MNDSIELNDERPLVTFALFAYNQEQYIREAIEGAFAQTYQPLEIILSDDCSSDRTFEIMQEMVAEYKGPHSLILRQSEVNFGTALHMQAVSNLSNGELIVIAAGDDISELDRCKHIVNLWLSKGKPIACIHSGITHFGESLENAITRKPMTESMLDQSFRLSYLKKDKIPFLSATCAYSIELFRNYKPFMGGSIIEDSVMSVRALLDSQILSINIPLVRQRKLLESGGTGHKIVNPDSWNRFILSRVISSINQARDISSSDIDYNLKRNLEKYYLRKAFLSSKFIISFSPKNNFFWKLRFFISYLIFFPSKIGFLNKLISSVHFVGYNETKAYKLVYSIYKYFKSKNSQS